MSGPIALLRGTIADAGRDYLIVECYGVGYRVYASAATLAKAGVSGDAVRLFIHEYQKEDVHQLFGFLAAEEQDVFERLLSVTGVGPRGALSFLSTMSPAELGDAIARRDAEALARVKGVGRKTAERVIYELAGKFSAAASLNGVSPALAARTGDLASAALLQQGYSAQEVAAALAQVPAPGEAPDEERVFQAMRLLDRRR
jgi:Holliday junction DNA helicase RuvA